MPAAHKLNVPRDVKGVMAGIAFMTCQTEHAIDRKREIAIDLNHTLKITLVTAEGAPRLVAHILHPDAFARRQVQMLQRLVAAGLERAAENCRKTVRRHHKFLIESRVSGRERSAAAKQMIDLVSNRIEARRIGRGNR